MENENKKIKKQVPLFVDEILSIRQSWFRLDRFFFLYESPAQQKKYTIVFIDI